MSKVNIKDSNLKDSPIIVDSPKAKINKETNKDKSKENKKNFFNNPWVIAIIGGIIVGLVLFYFIGDGKMPGNEEKPKVSIKNSTLEKSPVIVDSPGAITGENIYINQERQDRHLDEPTKIQLNSILPNDTDKRISVGIPPGSTPEVMNFAREIKTYLESSGWDVSNLAIVGNFPIFEGDISFKDYKDSFAIYVNHK